MFRLTDGTLVLSATDLTGYLACEHLAEQRRAIAAGERAKPRPNDDPHAQLVKDRGDEHERAQLERLSRELGGHVDLSGERAFTREQLEAAAARTAEAMRAGAPLIFQAQFFDGRWQGRVDFLRRIPRASALGDHAYEVLDTKLARAVKPHVVHQLALYNRLLAGVQRFEPDHAFIMLGDGTEVPIDLRRYAALHRHVVAALERFVAAGPPETYPEPTSHCGICDLAAECDARWHADDHLKLVAGIRREQRARLVDLGLDTVTDLAAAPQDFDPGRLGEDRFDILRHQAALQVRSRDERRPTHRHLAPAPARGYARLPQPHPGDVFFDLEGDPYLGTDGGVEYLWGWWTGDRGYECVWAHDVDAEKTALEQFVDFVVAQRATHPGMHVFHYAPHEASKLKSLALKYATREDEVDDLLRNGMLVDLYAVVRQGLQVGEESYSIKRLERHHGFVRHEHRVREGGGSIVAYETWLATGDADLLEAIRAYNEEDCRSTLALRDWLRERMCPEASAEFGVDFDELRDPEPETPYDPPAWLPEQQALAARLVEGLGADADGDRPEEAERRLLSHLLLYHYRESKPEWWRFFELRDMQPAQLVDERDAVGCLLRDMDVPPYPVKRSMAWTFRFPPQEVKLDAGRLLDPTTRRTYKVFEVGDEHVVVSQGPGQPVPQPTALISAGPIQAGVLREALAELARAVLGGGDDHLAARSVLRRERPRLRAGSFYQHGDAPTTQELCEATLALDRSHLVVQGPPGTGKTYQGARIVIAALRAGRRVGVTAQSHAAIQNLLEAIEDYAHEVGYRFDGVYKGHGYTSAHGLVEVVDENDGATPEYQLVAGTAWLFARGQHRGAFDLLVIDEAGQFALANAAAVALAARNVVLLGDPQQLPQVTQAAHPGSSGASVLEHLLAAEPTIPRDRGFFLAESWRMHPDVCAFVSERSYDGRLGSREACRLRRVEAPGVLHGSGLRFLPVAHQDCSQRSPEEAQAIAAACAQLLDGGKVTDEDGAVRPLEAADIMVVAPYNLAVTCIRSAVPDGVQVGTVDRFQGREAPVVFFAMTCSSGADVPRGLDFLFSCNRLNVAISRAQCLAVLVASPRLLDADCRTLEAMELVDGACRFVEMATQVESALVAN